MEEILSRFQHIGEDIFKELNGKDFCKSMEVSRSWNHFIRIERLLQTAYKSHKAYKKRIQEKIQDLTKEIENDPYSRHMKTTPFHHAAKRGDFPVCQQIMEYVVEKSPKDTYGDTPLHLAAENGHLSVCQLIVENVDDKNPKNNYGRTPFNVVKNADIKKLVQDAKKNNL